MMGTELALEATVGNKVSPLFLQRADTSLGPAGVETGQ